MTTVNFRMPATTTHPNDYQILSKRFNYS